MLDWIKQAAKKGLEFGAQHLANQAFIEQLLMLSGERALQELQAKVMAMDDQTFQGFMTSLTIMVSMLQQNIQQMESSTPFGSSYEDQLAYYAAGVQSGMGTGQSQAIHHCNQKIQALQTIMVYAGQFRTPMPAQSAPAPSSPDALVQRFVEELERGASQKTLFAILGELEKIAPDRAKRLARQYKELTNSPIRNLR